MPGDSLVGSTHRLMDLIEAGDVTTLEPMLHERVTWTIPMTMTGDPDDVQSFVGRAAFLDRVGRMRRVARSAVFVDRRVSVTRDGMTTFVQTRGDFVTALGKPYRNVYVFRFDWDDDRLRVWEEYANPVAVRQAYPTVPTSP